MTTHLLTKRNTSMESSLPAASIAFCCLSAFALCAYGTYIKPTAYQQKGDIVLGGLFPLHYGAKRPDNYSLESKPGPVLCEKYNFLGFRWMQSMLFAIEEINNRSDLLPNTTLGWQIFDTCNNNNRAVNQAVFMVDSLEDNMHENSSFMSVSAVVGPTASDTTIAVSSILSLFDVPQISYAATTKILSKKEIYNSFFRTIPNDDEQATAIVELLKYYNWTWVGAVAGDDDYGRPGIARLKEEAARHGICVEYTAYISESMEESQLRRISEEIRDFNATVFVAFIGASSFEPFAKELEKLGVTEKTWIASEAWAASNTVQKAGPTVFSGALGIGTRGGAMPGFRQFLRSLSPSSQAGSPFTNEFWELSFNCTCPATVCTAAEDVAQGHVHLERSQANCTGQEDLTEAVTGKDVYLDWRDDELEKTYNVYLAVYVIVQALQNIADCQPGNGLLKDGACPSMKDLKTWQLLAYIKKVNFHPPGSAHHFRFDGNGDPNASYKLVNWKPLPGGGFDVVSVGNYSITTTPQWSVDYEAIRWTNNSGVAPSSVCSQPCGPGYYKVQLVSTCCFSCYFCPQGSYSTTVNADTCTKCNDTERSNEKGTACIPKLEEYVRWTDPFGISFTCFSLLGIAITAITCGSFIRNRETPVVKATNRELSFFLFFSITLCFITPLFYVSEPQDWSCKSRSLCFVLSFTFCIAAILVKTVRVLTAFNAKFPVIYRKRAKWLGEHYQVAIVVAISLLQGVLCAMWLAIDPPHVHRVPSKASADTLTVDCHLGSNVMVGCVYGYLCLLALVAFVMAFKARKLPENFNEAKFVTFSMLIFFIVWLSFIPAYLTTSGVSATAVYCIAILASTFGFLGCIFFPKLYIIYITPTRNNIENVRMGTVHHALRSARSVLHHIHTPSDENGQSTVASSMAASFSSRQRHLRTTSPSALTEKSFRQQRWRKTFLENQANNSGSELSIDRKCGASPEIPNKFHDASKEKILNQQKQSEETNREQDTSSDVNDSVETTNKLQCKQNANNSSTTIKVDVEGKISRISPANSTASFAKTVQKDDEKKGASFNVKVDVQVNIQPHPADLNHIHERPPGYETVPSADSVAVEKQHPFDSEVRFEPSPKIETDDEQQEVSDHSSELPDITSSSSSSSFTSLLEQAAVPSTNHGSNTAKGVFFDNSSTNLVSP